MTLPDLIRSWTQHSHDGYKPTNEPQSFLLIGCRLVVVETREFRIDFFCRENNGRYFNIGQQKEKENDRYVTYL